MDAEKLEKSKNNLLKQLEEKKKIKKFKKKTEEESDFSDKFGSNKKDKKAGVGSLPKNNNTKFIKDADGNEIFIMTDEKKNFNKGGRVMLRGGGICKKGMNKKAIGANS